MTTGMVSFCNGLIIGSGKSRVDFVCANAALLLHPVAKGTMNINHNGTLELNVLYALYVDINICSGISTVKLIFC